jgi:hypothetical protein
MTRARRKPASHQWQAWLQGKSIGTFQPRPIILKDHGFIAARAVDPRETDQESLAR